IRLPDRAGDRRITQGVEVGLTDRRQHLGDVLRTGADVAADELGQGRVAHEAPLDAYGHKVSLPFCRARAPEVPDPRGPWRLRGSGEFAPSAPRSAGTLPRGVNGLCRGPTLTASPQARTRVSARSGQLGATPCAELVAGHLGDLGILVGVAHALARDLHEGAFDLAPDPPHGDAEDALTALDEVDDLVGRGALVDAGPVTHQGDLGEVLHPALTQVLDGDADLLQRDPRVQEPLDDLEHEDVAEAVQPLAAG